MSEASNKGIAKRLALAKTLAREGIARVKPLEPEKPLP